MRRRIGIRPELSPQITLGNILQAGITVALFILGTVIPSGHFLFPFTRLDFDTWFPNIPFLVLIVLAVSLLLAFILYLRSHALKWAALMPLLMLAAGVVGFSLWQMPDAKRIMIVPTNGGVDDEAWDMLLSGLENEAKRLAEPELRVVIRPILKHRFFSVPLTDPLAGILRQYAAWGAARVEIGPVGSDSKVKVHLTWHEPGNETARLPMLASNDRAMTVQIDRDQLPEDLPRAVVAYAGVNAASVYYARSDFERTDLLLTRLDASGPLRPYVETHPAFFYLLAKMYPRNSTHSNQYIELYKGANRARGALKSGSNGRSERKETGNPLIVEDWPAPDSPLQSVYYHLYLAIIDWQIGQFDEAFQHKSLAERGFRALPSIPNSPYLCPKSGLALDTCTAIEGELDMLTALMSPTGGSFDSPKSAEAWCDQGASYLQLGQASAAQQAFLEALRCDPGYKRALHALFRLYEDSGAHDEAENVAKRFPDVESIFDDATRYFGEMGGGGERWPVAISRNVKWRFLMDNEVRVELIDAEGSLANAAQKPILSIIPLCLSDQQLSEEAVVFEPIPFQAKSSSLLEAAFRIDSYILDRLAGKPPLTSAFFSFDEASGQLVTKCMLELRPEVPGEKDLGSGHLLLVAAPELFLQGADTLVGPLEVEGRPYKFTGRIGVMYQRGRDRHELLWADGAAINAFEFDTQLFWRNEESRVTLAPIQVKSEVNLNGVINFETAALLNVTEYTATVKMRHAPSDSIVLEATLPFTVTVPGSVPPPAP